MKRNTKAARKPRRRYEVQIRLLSGWENCWNEDDKPLTFASREIAERELREFLQRAEGIVEADAYRVRPVGEH